MVIVKTAWVILDFETRSSSVERCGAMNCYKLLLLYPRLGCYLPVNSCTSYLIIHH